MRSVSDKIAPGRQSQLPLGRAFEISMKSLKIRFWRSIITAGGIFLGIAFLATVLTQGLMQWPLPEKVDAGYVRIGGQVTGPGDQEVWKPVPVEEGSGAGIPQAVLDRVSGDAGTFSLATVVQGKLDAFRADKNLARVKAEAKALGKMSQKLLLFVDVAQDKDIKVPDAIKAGVRGKVARKLAGKGKTFKGSALADLIRQQPDLIPPFYAAAALDQDITVGDAAKAGVPEAIAKRLAGDGKTFKAGPLGDVIKGHPAWVKLWTARAKRYAIFKTVDDSSVAKLDGRYAITLGEALKEAKDFAKEANRGNVMVVNQGGRRITANFGNEVGKTASAKEKKAALAAYAKAGAVKLKNGDTIFVPDLNTKYRTAWLVVMSLLVCTVGITNSMLMSVTERFKEIGTMKCLGALDKFVVTLFMLESGMMGIVASIAGWVAGFLVMTVLAGFTKGWDMVGSMGFGDIGKTFLWSVAIGLLLTIIATIAPAKRAADMPPAMALRSEI